MNSIVENILSSKKYRALYPLTVERVVLSCLEKYGPERAEEEARTILHQIWGSYYPTRPDFKKLLKTFEAELAAGRREEAIDMVLRLHASSAERLPIFDEFYKKILAIILRQAQDKPLSMVDHGCCLDPIAFERIRSALLSCHPAVPAAGPSAPSYQAFDIDTEEVEFLKKACALLGYGEAVKVAAGDAISDDPIEADVVFMLKLLPVLEQQRKGSAKEVLMKQRAKWLVVSYPVASLSGKEKGMKQFYTESFYKIVEDTDWEVQQLEFSTELVFVIDTNK